MQLLYIVCKEYMKYENIAVLCFVKNAKFAEKFCF